MMQEYIDCALKLREIFKEIIIESFSNINNNDTKEIDLVNYIAYEGSKQCTIQLMTEIINNKKIF